jgi:Zn-dependent protease with chaperone function
VSIGALAGFALVFVVTAVTVSAVGGLALASARGWLQRLGPMAERRAAETVAIMPLVVALVAVAALVVQATVGIDHCQLHEHHAHLCFTHGEQWLQHSWVLVALAIAVAIFVGRAAITAVAYLRGVHSVRSLYRLSTQVGDVRIVESDRVFCFVARRGVFISSRVWSSLPSPERAALVAHEQAHVHRGDLRKRFVLEALVLFAAPFVGDRVRLVWLRASERLCDAHAARVTGEPETVARAMISMCRLGSAQPVPGFAFTPPVAELAGRIQAVLAGGPVGERAAAVFARVALACCTALAVLGVAAAESIHHAFETLLG